MSAFIDPPRIRVNPNFAQASKFNPEFGPHRVVGVPEPSTWAKMLGGFAGLGLVGWRSRRSDVSVRAATLRPKGAGD